jgi:hypothetical protein
MFSATSRYANVPIAEIETPDGKIVKYVRRRFIPPPERFALLEEHTVVGGDRMDLLAQRYLGDPEQYWRIADANNTLAPETLTDVPGTRLRITLPEGVPGGQPE